MPLHTDGSDLQQYFAIRLHDSPSLLDTCTSIMKKSSEEDFLDRLPHIGTQIDALTVELVTQRRKTETVLEIVSTIHEMMTCRIIAAVEKRVTATINLPAPVPYCWINMGSDARQEQIIRTDQDNALIYKQPDPELNTRTNLFFEVLATHITDALEIFGFKKCTGNVMASNPLWRRSDRDWLKTLDKWIGSSNPADIRNLTIFLDFRAVYGDFKLADKLHQTVFYLLKQFPGTNHYLVRDDNTSALPPKNTIKNKSASQPFNIKTSGLVHLINGIRLLAVNNRIKTPSTLGRIRELKRRGCISPEEQSHYKTAFFSFVELKIEHLLSRHKSDALPQNQIDLKQLSPEKTDKLKRALDVTRSLQQKVRNKYTLAWVNYFN